MEPRNVRRLAVVATIAVALGAFAINYRNVQVSHAKKRSLLKDGKHDDNVYTIRIDESGKITEHGDYEGVVGLPFQMVHGEALYDKVRRKAAAGGGFATLKRKDDTGKVHDHTVYASLGKRASIDCRCLKP